MELPLHSFFMSPYGFWATVAADFILVVSIFFAAFYAVAIFMATFIPGTSRVTPNAFCIPGLLVLAVLFSFSPAGVFLVAEAGSAMLVISKDFNYQPFLALGMVIAGAWAILLLIFRLILAMRAVSQMRKLDEDPALTRARATLGHRSQVRLREAGLDGLVASWGLVRPVIMVPKGFVDSFGEHDRFCMYLHELIHIRSRDSWKNLFAAVMRALFWFNPVARHALNRYSNHLEIICDGKVIHTEGVKPEEYAELIGRTLRSTNGLMTGFSSDFHDVVRRLRYIFRDSSLQSFAFERLWAAACMLMLAVCFTLAIGGQDRLGTMQRVLNPEMYAEIHALEELHKNDPELFRWHGLLGMYAANIWAEES